MIEKNGVRSDPTPLTTAQLLREVASLREILEANIEGKDAKVQARFDAMDKAVKLFESNLTAFPTEVDKAIEHLRELMWQRFDRSIEQFKNVEMQFKESDKRTEQAAIGTKAAVDAAFSAAKEAVAEFNRSNATASLKQEAAFTKQIDGLDAKIGINNANTDRRYDELKERVGTIESRGAGARENKDDSKSMIAIVVSCIAALVVLLQFALSVLRPPVITAPVAAVERPVVVYPQPQPQVKGTP